jgi:sugar/nucleoside kinase (ribokinase family)
MIEFLTIGEILVEIMRPKIGIPLNEIGDLRGPFPSGAPAIFINAVANLGHKGAIIGGVGNDEFGEIIISKLQKSMVETRGIKISELPTGVAFVAYNKDGSRKFIYHIRDSAATDIGSLPEDIIRKVKVFHIMGCSLMLNREIANIILDTAIKVKENGGIISFDPNLREELMNKPYIKEVINKIIDISYVVLPGLKELMLITGEQKKENAVKKALEKVKYVVLKLGSDGCEINIKDEKKSILIPAISKGIKVVDVTGAGDAFDAGFLCGLIEKKDLFDCGVLANACGSLNTTKLGPMEGIFNRGKVDKFIYSNVTRQE